MAAMAVLVVPRGMAEPAVTVAVALMVIRLFSLALLAGAAVTAVPVGSSQAMVVPAVLAVAAVMVQTEQLGQTVLLQEKMAAMVVTPATEAPVVMAVTEAPHSALASQALMVTAAMAAMAAMVAMAVSELMVMTSLPMVGTAVPAA